MLHWRNCGYTKLSFLWFFFKRFIKLFFYWGKCALHTNCTEIVIFYCIYLKQGALRLNHVPPSLPSCGMFVFIGVSLALLRPVTPRCCSTLLPLIKRWPPTPVRVLCAVGTRGGRRPWGDSEPQKRSLCRPLFLGLFWVCVRGIAADLNHYTLFCFVLRREWDLTMCLFLFC